MDDTGITDDIPFQTSATQPPTKAGQVLAEMEILASEMLDAGRQLETAIKELNPTNASTPNTPTPTDAENWLEYIKDNLEQMLVLDIDLKVALASLSKRHRDLEQEHGKLQKAWEASTEEINELVTISGAALVEMEIGKLEAVYHELKQRENSVLLERFRQLGCFDRLAYSGTAAKEEPGPEVLDK